jgi:predicted dehydrogenase
MEPARPLRIGILGAAKIAPFGIIRPARAVAEAEVVAVAARDESRARKFAARHGLPRAHASYEALLRDPEVDAVYNPLPNGLHCEWTVRALDAGKHVLCEKPLASNADEAGLMAAAAERNDRRLMEAFHWRYHPLADRMKEIVDGGSLGVVREIAVKMCLPVPIPGDIRYRYDLAGGATMDMGCYTISILRFLAGAEPEVVGAKALLSSPEVDRAMRAEFRFEDGRRGRIHCSMFSASLLALGVRVVGDAGELSVLNPIAPQLFHRLTLRTASGSRRERVPGEASYTGQLRAFVAHVRDGAPVATDAAHGIANMRVIDAVYDAAGLKRRGSPGSGS